MPTIKILNNTLQAIDGSTIQTDNDISYNYNAGVHYFYSKNGYNLIFPHSQLTALYLGGSLIPIDPDPFVNAEQIADYIYVNSGGGGGGGEPLFLAFYNARVLQTAGLQTTFDWAAVKMYDLGSNLTMNGDTRYLYDEVEELAVGFNTVDRKLYGSRGVSSVSYDWDLGQLYDSVGDLAIDTANRKLYRADGTIAYDWQLFTMYDSLENESIGINNRLLSAADSSQSINWNTRMLINGNNDAAINWGDALDNSVFIKTPSTFDINTNSYSSGLFGVSDTGYVYAGDSSSNTMVDWNISAQQIRYDALNGHIFSGSNIVFRYPNLSSDNYFIVSPLNGEYGIGDISGISGNTFMSINDSVQSIENSANIFNISTTSGNQILNFDPSGSIMQFGDIANVINNSRLGIDFDAGQTFHNAPNGHSFNSPIYVSNGIVIGSVGSITSEVNMIENDSVNLFFTNDAIETGTILSGNVVSGSFNTLNTAEAIEIKIGGVTKYIQLVS